MRSDLARRRALRRPGCWGSNAAMLATVTRYFCAASVTPLTLRGSSAQKYTEA